MLTMTNAVKAQIIAAANAVLGVLAAFDVGAISDTQKGALLVAVNAVLSLLVLVTYKASSKRLPDPVVVPPPPPVAAPRADQSGQAAAGLPPALAGATTAELQAALAARQAV